MQPKFYSLMRAGSNNDSEQGESLAWSFSILRLINQVLFFSTGFPYLGKDKIGNQPAILRGVSSLEFREYLELSKKRIHIALINLFLYGLYFIKNFFIVFSTLLLFDHLNPENSVKETLTSPSSNEQYKSHYQFSCIETNCKKLTKSSSLAQDMIRLPMLYICKPEYSSIYAPIIFLGSYGLFLQTIVSYEILIIGAGLSLMQYQFPLSCESLMFALTPNLKTNQIRIKLKDLFINLNSSLVNYKSIVLGQKPGDLVWARPKMLISKHKAKEDLDELVEDCLPVIRSNWWRSRLIKLILLTGLTIYCIYFCMGLLLLTHIDIELERRKALLQEMSHELIERNCSIWRSSSFKNQPIEYVHLEQMKVGWTIYSVLELTALVAQPVFAMIVELSYVYGSICELTCWLEEVKLQILLAIELAKLHETSYRPHNNNEDSSSSKPIKEFKLTLIREKFKENTNINFIYLQVKPMKLGLMDIKANQEISQSCTLNIKLAHQEFIFQLMASSDWNGPESYYDMMAKIYISFRLFVDFIGCYSPHVVKSVATSLIVNYGYAIISFWYSRQIKDFTLEPIVLVLFAWAFSTILILLTAKFHAQARKLHPLVWTLISQLADSNDIKIQHIRSLLLRQIELLDLDGGMVLKSSILRLTYIDIIHLWIWTATILVLTL